MVSRIAAPFAAWLVLAFPVASPATSGDGPIDRVVEREVVKARQALDRVELWEDHSTWASAWEVPTDHYLVRMAGMRRKAIAYGELLERMYGYFNDFIGVEPPPEALPLRVFIFPDIGGYNDYGQQGGAGPESSKHGGYFNQNDPQLPVVTYFYPFDYFVNKWLTQGALHQYVQACYPAGYAALPSWISYGLASYFEIFIDWEGSKAAFENLRRTGQLLALRNLLDARIDNYEDRHFTQLGMLFYYLIHVREGTRTEVSEDGTVVAPFRDYLIKRMSNVSVDDDPIHKLLSGRLLPEDFGRLDADFKAMSF